MQNRESVGSFIASHRADVTRPDRGIFVPPDPLAGGRAPVFRAAPHSSTVQHSGQSDGKKATGAKAADAAAAYEHLLTIQNAANLEYPATDPANTPTRTEFRLGIFPPTHHTTVAPPTPTPPTPGK